MRRFLENPETVLLGTASFWEGVDLAGESLQALLVARLPFNVPTEPVFEARSEQFENSFMQYALPQAILRLRQGFGRLIRTKTDRGAAVILDSRLVSRRYGRLFVDSLPPATRARVPLYDLGGAGHALAGQVNRAHPLYRPSRPDNHAVERPGFPLAAARTNGLPAWCSTTSSGRARRRTEWSSRARRRRGGYRAAVRDYLRLDDDLEAICDRIRVDDRIAAAMLRYPGLRVLRQEPWECLVSFICSANNNVPRISVNVEDIAENFGRPLAFGEHRRSAFPSPARLAQVEERDLRALGLGFRAKYVAGAARIVAAGGLDLYALREVDYDTALKELLELPGVGDKVGNCILLMSLDKREAFPVDVWIDRALREWYPEHVIRADGKPLTRAAMRPWAQSYFGEFAGYANQYLFQGRRLLAKGRKRG